MKNILLFITNGSEIYEISTFADVFSWNNTYGSEKINIEIISFHKFVKCTGNITIQTERNLQNIDVNDYDALAIPGGFRKEGFFNDIYNDDFLNIIKDFDNQNKPIASICVGALPIAKSGVLSNRRATTYKGNGRNELKKFNVKLVNKKIVIDNNIITSEGPSTGINVSLKLLEMLTNKKNSNKIKKLMGF
ncbi:MAG: DJ-1/PfpI family protein [bacterium]|nr:DJ-1/PfpI family protein [bacterium]